MRGVGLVLLSLSHPLTHCEVNLCTTRSNSRRNAGGDIILKSLVTQNFSSSFFHPPCAVLRKQVSASEKTRPPLCTYLTPPPHKHNQPSSISPLTPHTIAIFTFTGKVKDLETSSFLSLSPAASRASAKFRDPVESWEGHRAGRSELVTRMQVRSSLV